MQIYDYDQLMAHPILGASWEGYALEQVVRRLGLSENQLFTWNVQSGAEMDLVIMSRGRLFGVEFKNAEAPRTTRSFTLAFQELDMVAAAIVHPGPKTFELAEGRWAVSIQDLGKLEELFGMRKGRSIASAVLFLFPWEMRISTHRSPRKCASDFTAGATE